MKLLFTLNLLAVSSMCFGQFTKDKKPVAPSIDTVAAAQSYHTSLAAARTDAKVYICDSKTAKAYHKDEDCRGLNRCTHGVVKVTKREAVEEYGRVPCQVCY
jgi:hypothetical protein